MRTAATSESSAVKGWEQDEEPQGTRRGSSRRDRRRPGRQAAIWPGAQGQGRRGERRAVLTWERVVRELELLL